jgi:hypothetical protein
LAFAANERDRINIEKERYGTLAIAGLGIEKAGLAKGEFELVHPPRVLMQEIPKFGRRLVGGGDLQKQGGLLEYCC